MELEEHCEPLPGYRLLEKLGSGGYGEVWRVEAPGGLTKAIKFVFGTEHEKRATHERKSLQRIKELRHPFLLSLERIEVVDGRLLVVTELADGSLKDVFDRHRAEGRPGIPRQELLGYLRDAADALDYMFDAHALQHLDIKPENLLIVGGHVKVADFGLVKDVQQSQASIVGGMTPLYSAPEVFRGRPGSRSDQYSLAIVYQEMLTGMLPFSGMTAAELTLQHLNDEPGLSPLDGADRFVIARALSKDPSHRYASCREFVEALFKSDAATGYSTATVSQPGARCSNAVPTSDRQRPATEVFDDDDESWKQPADSLLFDAPAIGSAEVADLGPIDFEPGEFQPAPTLFLGVGGVGGHVLQHLRRLINERVGNADRLPSIRMLLLDTDPAAIMSAARADDGLTAEETLALPLRRPQHYRDNANRLLSWLSRRWLYNLPKSMRTEGLRPLGRLALVDHARQVCQRIRQALVQATDDLSIAQSRDTFGLTMAENRCRVYIVASVAGGTGSGTAIDLGYAVRAAFDKMGMCGGEVVAVLTHSTTRDPRQSDLARVNTYSWLNEYQHFLRPGVAYPGDNSCGLPAHPAGVRPFDHLYLLHLGDGLGDDDFDQSVASVAEYLYLNALTSASTFFDACRRDDAGRTNPIAQLRTFAVEHVGATPPGLSESVADEIARRVFTRWLNGALQGSGNGDAAAAGMNWSAPQLAARARQLLVASLGCEEEVFLDQYLDEVRQKSPEVDGAAALDAVNALFRKTQDGNGNDASSLIVVRAPLAATVAPLVDELRGDLTRFLDSRLDEPTARLAGSRGLADALVARLETVQATGQALVKELAAQLVELRRQIAEPADPAAQADAAMPLAYFRLRLEHCAMIAVQHIATALKAQVKVELDQLNQLARDIKQLSGHLQMDQLSSGIWGEAGACAGEISALTQRLDELVQRVDSQIQLEFIAPQGGFRAVFSAGARVRAQLFSRIKETTQRTIQLALNDVDVLARALTPDGAQSLVTGLGDACSELLQYGGARRVLAVLPKGANAAGSAEQVRSALGNEVSLIMGSENTLVVCQEAQNVPLAPLALGVVQRRRDFVEFAERVHTRSDIQWSKITDQLNRPAQATPRPAVACTLALADSRTQAGDIPQESL